MASNLQVDIVTPEASAYSGPASEVLLPAWEGEMGIYPEHDALLTLIRAGRCSVTTPEGVKEWIVGRGFAEVSQTRVTILTDSCEEPGNVDRDGATADLKEAEETLATADVASEKWRQAQIAEEHAKARLGL
ncbi:MAG: ATP synthase F1 subunit epsilon [Myxococcales bacterium]|nr:ATP synthase F1 subunit epsilon [Myxococcales bacterium]